MHFDSPDDDDGEEEPEAGLHGASAMADTPPDDGMDDGRCPVDPDHDQIGRELFESIPSCCCLADRLGEGEAHAAEEEAEDNVCEDDLLLRGFGAGVPGRDEEAVGHCLAWSRVRRVRGSCLVMSRGRF